MAYGDFKDIKRTTVSDKVLRDRTLNIAKSPKFDGYQRPLISMVYKFFDKKTSGGAVAVPQNEQLAEKLNKSIIRKLKKKKSIFSI